MSPVLLLLHHNPNPLGIQMQTRTDEIMRNFHIIPARLKQVELEPAWCKHGGDGEVHLAIRQAMIEAVISTLQGIHAIFLIGQTYFMPTH